MISVPQAGATPLVGSGGLLGEADVLARNLVEVFSPLNSKNSEGTSVHMWPWQGILGEEMAWDDGLTWDDSLRWFDGPFLTFMADVQPITLTPYQLAEFGMNDLGSNAKKMICDPRPEIVDGMRVRVDGARIYDVKGSNHWDRHSAFVLSPVQGI